VTQVLAEPLGLYLHFPFCSVRCTYCDFPTVAGRDDAIESYLAALRKEIATFQGELPRAVDTIYLGGGTPSRMTPAQLARTLEEVDRRFDVASDAEITLEGNPESLTLDHLRGYRDAGVNRISVGVQSFDDGVLAAVGRAHDATTAEGAVRRARAVGFPDVGLDLIAGLPGEDLGTWGRTVDRAARLGVDHLSIYLLETDKDTPLGRAVRGGRTIVPGDDDLVSAYEESVAILGDAGLRQYEISNFARGGHASRHNLKYWSDAQYAGFGLGSHGYVSGERRANRKDLDTYLRDVASGRDPLEWTDPWDPERRLQEALFLGLRLVEGLDLATVSRRYGIDPEERYRAAWERARDAGILEREGSRVRLTPFGRLRSNELFAEFV
jgi:oxygen-independent coproporphyrinogen-3 oxidase